MGQQIVRRRKKRGRPSNSDLTTTTTTAHRSSAAVSFNHRRLRRSSRRRSTFKYNIIDSSSSSSSNSDEEEDADFNSEDEVEDEEIGRRRRERKLKLVLKLNNSSNYSNRGSSRGVNGVCSRNRRRTLEESEEEEEEEERVKKRRISVNDCEEDEEEEEEEGGEEEEEEEEDEGRRRNGEQEKDDSGPGTPTGRSVTPLPDKKRLELILDKLQKKDSYGVYAEPVDPEELPDYHDVIEHPMDFSTIRKKLANGSYSSLEQFENDVFLICSNAMLYNAPETIYHKQARAIKELAEKKFQHIRDDFERLEKEVKAEQVPKPEPISQLEPMSKPEPMPKSEQQSKSNSSISKQMRTQISRSTQERIGSDHVSDAAPLATAVPQKAPIAVHVGNGERQSNNGGHLEGSSSLLADNSPEKLEDQQSGKSLVPKLGKRSVDENRRQSYDPSNQPLDSVDSIFMTFEGEKKQLISVGLQGEHPYARSLARFAGTLGPVAWKFASKRIEQALPSGIKFGRVWVGEYEPLPTPLLFRETRPQKDPFSMKLQGVAACNNEIFSRTSVPANGHVLPAKRPNFDVKPSGGSKPPTPKSVANKQQNPLSRKSMPLENKYMQQSPVSWDPVPTESKVAKRAESQSLATTVSRDSVPLEGKVVKSVESNSMATTVSRDSVPQEIKVVKRVESHSPTITNQNWDHTARNLPCAAEMPSRSMDPMTRSKSSMQQLPFKQPEVNGFVVPGGLRNEKSVNNSLDINQAITSPRSISSPRVVGQASFPWRQEQGLSDPVQVMRNVSEQTRKRPDGSSPYLGPLHVRAPSTPSPSGEIMRNVSEQTQNPPNVSSPYLGPLHDRPPSAPSPSGDIMRNVGEQTQKPPNGFGHLYVRPPSVPSPSGDNKSNAAAAAANVWMSVGAGGFKTAAEKSGVNRNQISSDSLYNTSRDFYEQMFQSHGETAVSGTMHFHPEKRMLPFQAFAPQPVKITSDGQVYSRPMMFPQFVTTDMSRLQVQSPHQGISPHTQQRQKQDKLPPDLNIAFPSPVDSQQPDLALQL